jgi:phosphohistidine phosphatase SixA
MHRRLLTPGREAMELLIIRHANAFERDRRLTSTLVRARQTAKILTDVAGWPRTEEAPEVVTSRPQDRPSNKPTR